MLLLAVMIALLVMISITGEGREQLTPVEDILLAVFAPVQTVFSSAGRRLQSLYDAVIFFHQLRAENERLREEMSKIEGQLIQLQELRNQNYRYRRMLEFKEKSGFDLLPAEVIARDPSQWFGAITINRGYLDGVKREAAVITDRGLVGMVTTVSPNSSQVILITDPRPAVGALVLRSREHGIVESYSKQPSFLRIINLPPEADILPGDLIISSGLGGIFPYGIAIGTVKAIEDDHLSLVKSALVEPRVNFNRLEEVFIVMGGASEASLPR